MEEVVTVDCTSASHQPPLGNRHPSSEFEWGLTLVTFLPLSLWNRGWWQKGQSPTKVTRISYQTKQKSHLIDNFENKDLFCKSYPFQKTGSWTFYKLDPWFLFNWVQLILRNFFNVVLETQLRWSTKRNFRTHEHEEKK